LEMRSCELFELTSNLNSPNLSLPCT
jgi:hypothetical protein